MGLLELEGLQRLIGTRSSLTLRKCQAKADFAMAQLTPESLVLNLNLRRLKTKDTVFIPCHAWLFKICDAKP